MAEIQHTELDSVFQSAPKKVRGSILICGRCGNECECHNPAQLYCRPCAKTAKLEGNRRRNKKYEASRPPRKRDKPIDKERRKRWEQRNREKLLAKSREYNERNRELVNRKSRERNRLPEVKAKRREIDRKYSSRPKQRLDQRMKTAIKIALRGNKAGKSWETLVGYTLQELISHIERQFTRGMSWDNIGEWHIDHIVPKVTFKYTTPDDPEFRACWALTNLRPLWADENHSKHARRTHLL